MLSTRKIVLPTHKLQWDFISNVSNYGRLSFQVRRMVTLASGQCAEETADLTIDVDPTCPGSSHQVGLEVRTVVYSGKLPTGSQLQQFQQGLVPRTPQAAAGFDTARDVTDGYRVADFHGHKLSYLNCAPRYRGVVADLYPSAAGVSGRMRRIGGGGCKYYPLLWLSPE